MSKSANRVGYMIPYFWELFTRYQNDPNYFIQQGDILASKFGNGEKDVKELIEACNTYAKEHSLQITFNYKLKLTYKELLKQLNHVTK